jgi:hypothetical protein
LYSIAEIVYLLKKSKEGNMAKKGVIVINSGFFLKLGLGIFFLFAGILGITEADTKLSELARFLGRDDTMRYATAIIEIVAGVVLLVRLFVSFGAQLNVIAMIVLFALWGLYILVNYVFKNFGEPDTMAWLYGISRDSIILIAIWITGKN